MFDKISHTTKDVPKKNLSATNLALADNHPIEIHGKQSIGYYTAEVNNFVWKSTKSNQKDGLKEARLKACNHLVKTNNYPSDYAFKSFCYTGGRANDPVVTYFNVLNK